MITVVYSSQGLSPRVGNGKKSYSPVFPMEGSSPAGVCTIQPLTGVRVVVKTLPTGGLLKIKVLLICATPL